MKEQINFRDRRQPAPEQLLPLQGHIPGASAIPPLAVSSAHPNSGKAPGRILSIGRDEDLLESRAGVLRLTGREVRSATPSQAKTVAAGETFSLVVFGHTLSDKELEDLVSYFRQASPQTRLLVTCVDTRPECMERLFDAAVQTAEGPAVLVQAAAALLAHWETSKSPHAGTDLA